MSTNSNLKFGPHTHLKPRDTNTLSNASPEQAKTVRSRSLSPERVFRPSSAESLSPIRRSGSPVRRQQIQEIEQRYRNLKRKAETRQEEDAQDAKNVKFNDDVQYFENTSIPSPKLKLRKMDEGALEAQVQELLSRVEKIESKQDKILAKLEAIDQKLG